METNQHWEILFQRHKEPCFLVDAKTDEVVYLNDNMKLLLGNNLEVIGEKFYKVIKNEVVNGNGSVEEIPPNFDWSEGKVLEREVYDSTMNLHFNITVLLLEYKDKTLYFMKCIPETLVSEKTSCFEQAMTDCIAIMQEDEKTRVPHLLEVLGKHYGADKTYLYRVDHDTMHLPCINYWKKSREILVSPDLSLKMDVSRLLEWLKTRNEAGMLEATLVADQNSHNTGEDLLQVYHLNDLVMSVVEDEAKEAVALLIVSNRTASQNDFRLIQAVSKFVEHDITHSQIKDSVCQETSLDILTGFRTRISYAQRVEEIQNHAPQSIGVVLANVNGLKMVNSEFGYVKGDYMIKKSADMVKEHFNTDFYRIAGDEFVAFFPDIDKEAFEKSCVALQQKLKESEKNLFAVGHSWNTGKYDVLEMIQEADTVMYINKQEYYHNAEIKFHDITDSTLSDLLSFLEDEEFMIYLQPQVRLEDGSLHGAEALIRRYDKKNKKMVFPDQFISLYEKKSIIRHVDIFVVEQVCKLLSEWDKEGKALPISVNLSRVTLLEYGIVKTISDICELYSVPKNLLVIEVTERVGLIENEVASSLIVDFVTHGFKISLDDFGCAYSNIVTLAQIDVDEVKLDKSLVDNLTMSNKNKILVRNVLNMCNELDDTATLAEGIENNEQGQMLYELGCKLGQGYYYSRPIPVQEFEEKYISPDVKEELTNE
ncbi:MAG: GGDEF domain-containing phosphodiesterase [Eubacteriales bacterium]